MMLGVPIYVLAASALVVASLPLLAYSVAGTRKKPLPETAAELPLDQREALLRTGPLDRVILPTIKGLGRGVRRISPAGWIDSTDRRIRLAGSPRTWTLERTLAVKMILAIFGIIGGTTWGGGLVASGMLTGVLAGLFGYALPDLLLWSRGKERQAAIQKELPDTMDQLTISVEAGLGFDAAMTRVASTGQGPLAEELRRMLGEVKVGVPRKEALRHLLDRTDVQELRHFVLALQQAEDYGLPVARVLRVQSSELRVKRRQRAEEQAMKIPVKIVFPLVLCIFPALFVVLLGPAVIRVMRTLF
ncbi:MAG TPA: type II secretion system F family protein [Acidimicrobiia bacterium]|nr:type II secretion system F family protein [Acidimicrobiia bacterium]